MAYFHKYDWLYHFQLVTFFVATYELLKVAK